MNKITISKVHEMLRSYNGNQEFINDNMARRNTYPRQILCYLARKHCQPIYLREIGEYVGYHHATVLHSIKMINDFLDVDKRTRELISDLELDILIEKQLSNE
ncbi:MAG TPA: helix-turn-helix domain-containing protein [Flavobacteriaceae bacterium]|nr:helix-turn-helix domain-containing protein [Flavobacteriaceae bacterium]